MQPRVMVQVGIFLALLGLLWPMVGRTEEPIGAPVTRQAVRITATAFQRNRQTGLYETRITLTNPSTRKRPVVVHGPLSLLLTRLDQSGTRFC